ncbi:hypothetical protein ACFROC_20715 [Nocardia tengchongensis]|uniref:hypothetical protein n=1 Tax=Nocardia tengchongensis TaxID=2055889 RepID=UPI0036B570AC
MSDNTIEQTPAEMPDTTADIAADADAISDRATDATTTGTGTGSDHTTDTALTAADLTADRGAELAAAETSTAEPETVGRGWKSRLRAPVLPALGARARIAVGAAVVLALAASLGSSVYLYRHDGHNRDLLAAQEQARSAACAYAPLLATYDAKNLDAYFTAVEKDATGDWRKQFDATSKELRDVLTQGQVVSKATDVQCAVRTADRDSAEAIVVIGQTITSLGTQGKPAPGQLSMVMRLERSGDRWLVNKVNSPLAQQPQS